MTLRILFVSLTFISFGKFSFSDSNPPDLCEKQTEADYLDCSNLSEIQVSVTTNQSVTSNQSDTSNNIKINFTRNRILMDPTAAFDPWLLFGPQANDQLSSGDIAPIPAYRNLRFIPATQNNLDLSSGKYSLSFISAEVADEGSLGEFLNNLFHRFEGEGFQIAASYKESKPTRGGWEVILQTSDSIFNHATTDRNIQEKLSKFEARAYTVEVRFIF